jgi:hypothetical protein
MKERTKKNITQSLRWSIFIMSAITLTAKIVETTAYASLEIITKNPEIAQYSTLVNS